MARIDIRPGGVLRDGFLITLASFVIGFLIGFVLGVVHAPPASPLTIVIITGAGNLLCLVVGFTVSASVAAKKHGRWGHLAMVGLATWLFGAVNVAIGLVSLADWLAGILVVAVAVAIGGGLSHLVTGRVAPADRSTAGYAPPEAYGARGSTEQDTL